MLGEAEHKVSGTDSKRETSMQQCSLVCYSRGFPEADTEQQYCYMPTANFEGIVLHDVSQIERGRQRIDGEKRMESREPVLRRDVQAVLSVLLASSVKLHSQREAAELGSLQQRQPESHAFPDSLHHRGTASTAPLPRTPDERLYEESPARH